MTIRGDLPGIKAGRSWVYPAAALWPALAAMAMAQASERKRERTTSKPRRRQAAEAAAVGEGSVIHYHGLPITPDVAALPAISAGHAFVSFRHPGQLALAVEHAQSFAVDNGAFSAWRTGDPVADWSSYYAWAEGCRRVPSCDWAVIPDVIDGTESDNDALLAWPQRRNRSIVVWRVFPVGEASESPGHAEPDRSPQRPSFVVV